MNHNYMTTTLQVITRYGVSQQHSDNEYTGTSRISTSWHPWNRMHARTLCRFVVHPIVKSSKLSIKKTEIKLGSVLTETEAALS
jgi:hypothetical protein